MRIRCFGGHDGKSLVVPLQVARQERIRAGQVLDAGQAHRFDKAILQGLEQPLDPSLGLRRQRSDAFNAQRVDRPLELRRHVVFRIMFAKDSVPVAVERGRAAIGKDVSLQGVEIGLTAFHRREARRYHLAGGVVDEGDRGAPRSASSN